MTQLETMSGIQGRALLRDIYRELRFDRQLRSLATLRICWQICTSERELFRLTKKNVVVLHPLGIWSGTSLWMQEIVNRYYFSVINSFVYFGAAMLLMVVGLYRFHVITSELIVVAGIILEAMLLVTMFVVMFFSPPEEPELSGADQDQHAGMTDELLRELGEIGRDYAAMAVQLESISTSLVDLVERQETLITSMRDSVAAAVQAVAPNPDLMDSMRDASRSLDDFAGSVNVLTERLHAVERQEVERLVRIELERILSNTILHGHDRSAEASQTR